MHGKDSHRVFHEGGAGVGGGIVWGGRPPATGGAGDVGAGDGSEAFVARDHRHAAVEEGPTPSELLGFSIAEV